MDTNGRRSEILVRYQDALLARATQIRGIALAPHAGLQAGAAVLMRSGEMFVGSCHVASVLCAERVALMGLEAGRRDKRDIVAIAVDGTRVCLRCLGELRAVESADDPILVLHRVNGKVFILRVDGSMHYTEPVAGARTPPP